VGCTLALLLRAAGRTVAIVEPRGRGEAAAAARPLALSYASRIILERAGAWRALAVTPIEAVHVSQAAGFGRTRMSAADAGVPALGYVIDYRALTDAFAAQVRAAGIEIADEATDVQTERAATPLVVHAEGGVEDAKEKRYNQTALVALVSAQPRAERTAYERFTPEGPLALLPLAGSYGMVWAASAERASALLALPPQEFLRTLQDTFGRRAGRFSSVEARASVSLALRVRASRIDARQAFVGNSAQTLHPVAGQGLNLGLRDAWELARAIGDAPDPGDPRVLDRYAARRRADAFATIRATDLLAGLFVGANPLTRTARGVALCALDLCAPARRFLARRMIYGPSAIP
jgi:2-octaprenyl-6-methoxyphenol hydroxylase